MARIPKVNKTKKENLMTISASDFADLDLTPKDLLFIGAYCTNGFKGYLAAKAAGYKGTDKVLQSTASMVMKKENVGLAIRRFIDAIMKPFKDKLEYEVLEAYYKRATYKITDFVDNNGYVKPLNKIPEEFICCIDGVEKKYFGKDADTGVTTYILPNRDTALQMLYKFATGMDPVDTKTPSEARDNLKAIFEKAFEESVSKKTTVTVEEEFKMSNRKVGKPKELPKIIEVHKTIRGKK